MQVVGIALVFPGWRHVRRGRLAAVEGPDPAVEPAAAAVLTCRAMSPVLRPCLAAIVLAALPAARADEPFRCGKWIVTSEMTLSELKSRCGPPTSSESRTQDVRVRNRNNGLMVKTGETTVETLTWDRGSRAAAMVVTVVDGDIKSIERKP